jgi:hypothetical protein
MTLPRGFAVVLLLSAAPVAMSCGGGASTPHGDASLDAIVPKPDVLSGHDASSDAPRPPSDAGVDAPIYPAKHSAMPQVVNFGGKVFTTPNIVPIFFSGDSDQTTITGMLTGLGASSYWSATTSEYGVMGATVATAIVVTDAAPTTISDSEIQTWLQTNLNGSDPTWGSPAPGDIYVVFYPASTTVTSSGTQSCVNFGGYHNETTDSMGNPLAYAVIPRCSGTFPPIPKLSSALTSVQYATFVASRDIIEATTDPEINTNPAYQSPNMNNIAWGLLAGGEVGDMCLFVPNIDVTPSSFPYAVQRSWSNASASASHDPCVPIPAGEVYFNSAPVMTDHVILGVGSSVGVQISVGQSKTIPIELYSDGPTTGPWTISAIDVASVYNMETPALAFAFDKNSGQNGDVVHMTITAMASDPFYSGDLFILVSTLGDTQSIWIGAVGN